MKIFKLISLLTIPVIATVPFVLSNKYKVVRYGVYTPTPVDNDIKEIKEKMSNLENKVDTLEKKIDRAQLCKIKKDVDELKKIVYALIGTIGGSSVLVSGSNLIKKKKNNVN